MADIRLADHPPVQAPAAELGGRVLGEAGGPVTGTSAASPSAARDAARHVTMIARRALDVVVATLVLVCLLPLLLVVAALIKLDSPGPILFRQRRIGKELRPFTVLKFRTMHTNASSDAHMRYIAEVARAQE
ncbi:MAG: sugar transferase, partial [Actinomycetota bacterium]|nr:sugar transferase [Actinomycetota bacterium]